MSELDQMYREVISTTTRTRADTVSSTLLMRPRSQNPLCGDEVSIFVAFGDDGETIDVRFGAAAARSARPRRRC